MASSSNFVNVSVSTSGLQHIHTCDDFEFIVDQKPYQCPKYVADFISPKISRLHEADPLLDAYLVESSDPDKLFGKFLAIGRGEALQVTESNLEFFCELSREMDNYEVLAVLRQHFIKDLTIENCEEQFALQTLAGEPLDSFVAFCASHFYELPLGLLEKLRYNDLNQILNHSLLRIESEDALLEYVIVNVSRDDSIWTLLEFVQFELLSVDSMKSISTLGSAFLSILNAPIWERLMSRLLLDVHPPCLNKRLPPDFKYKEESPLNGIISHLTAKYGGNVFEKGVVDITASSLLDDNNLCKKYAVELDTESEFATGNVTLGQSITYDFKGRRIHLSGYTIRSRANPIYYPYDNLKSWVLEVSIDGQSWNVIDTQSDNSDLNGKGLIKYFSIQSSQPCRFIRLRQTGVSHSGSQLFVFSALEFFGQLRGHK
jgi:hypothetical protein